MDLILDGRATPAQAGAFLLLQRYKGETPDELLGFIDAVRARPSTRLLSTAAEGILDVGSPYDGRLRNIVVSPAASIVAAAAGVPVLLHGEPGVPPKHGVTVGDVLEGLGVTGNAPVQAVEQSLATLGIAYLRQTHFAPDIAALKWLREETALRSPLNMVEKIYDPASAPYHLVGLTHLPYLEKLGGALTGMGFRRTALVQGLEGNEDLPTHRGVRVIEFTAGGEQREYRLNAADYGLEQASEADLALGDGPRRSGDLTMSVLNGEAPPAWRDLVSFNAGFRIELAGRAADLSVAIEMAQEAIESGAGRRLLERWQTAG
jgi:anthranilate phosphoribosyltransferase